MPDLFLLKPLCDLLDISINELLNGAYINSKEKEENVEKNFVNAINYSKQREYVYEILFNLFILLFGIIMLILSMSIFSSPIGFTAWYSLILTYLFIIVFSYFLKKVIVCNKPRKYVLSLIICFFVLYFSVLWTIDYVNVKKNGGMPDIFVISTFVTDSSYSSDTLFYDVHICNVNQENEYKKIVFDLNHDINIEMENINKYCKK